MFSRLQNRCLASSALAHGLLAALLLFGQGFHSRNDDLLAGGPPLELVGGDLVQEALAAPGPKGPGPVTPSVPAPPVAPPKAQEPPPARAATPPPKAASDIQFELPRAAGGELVLPAGRKAEKEPPKKAAPEIPKFDFENVKSLPKPQPRKPSAAELAARDRAAAEEAKRERLRNLASTLAGATGTLAQKATGGGIKVELSRASQGGGGGGGGGGGAGAGGAGGASAYAWTVQRIYENAWIAPQNVSDSLATTEVEVFVHKDGRVVRARIVKKTGIAALDASVQNVLDRISQLPPFEAGATESQRSFTIGFNMHGRTSF